MHRPAHTVHGAAPLKVTDLPVRLVAVELQWNTGRMIDAAKAFSGFSVQQIPEAKAFYEGVLGLPVTEEHGMLWINVGADHRVLLYAKGATHEPASFTVLNFPVADVDTAVDELKAKGVEFLHYDGMTDSKGVNRHGGPLIAWFTDPSGNVLSVLPTP
ncbi:MAG: glyoxalase [Micrococcaceae bacterium]|jgi:catechol 2,3-dioxygenase-like lactoylglutathione lyase family enzyme|nr:glyoxalase [Micrococcaceae bacterium]